MLLNISNQLTLEKVEANNNHIKTLYELLKKRKQNQKISSNKLPTLADHQAFVKKHPYRVWFLVFYNDQCIGNLYLSKKNEIGIFLVKNEEVLKEIIKFLKEKYKPLKAIASVRAKNFIINISPNNVMLKKYLKKIGAKLIQYTYLIE